MHTLEFSYTNGSPKSDQKIRFWVNQPEKKTTFNPVDFDVPADNRAKIKENMKIDKYLDLAGGLRKQRNIKITVKRILIGTLGMVPVDFE